MTVVFTDVFTVGTSVNIDGYPAGSPDYVYVRGSAGNFRVLSGTGKATTVTADSSMAARISDASVPTGNQEITADCTASSSSNCGFVCVRTNTQQFYDSYLGVSAPNEVQLLRRDNSTTWTLLASADRGLGAGTHTTRLRATGTGATVSLELQVGGTAVLTYDDSSAQRITSGTPGIGGYDLPGNTMSVDALSVDDLAGAPGSLLSFMMHHAG